jgi:hypothetical protein
MPICRDFHGSDAGVGAEAGAGADFVPVLGARRSAETSGYMTSIPDREEEI